MENELLERLKDCVNLLNQIGNRIDIPADLFEWYSNTLMNSEKIIDNASNQETNQTQLNSFT